MNVGEIEVYFLPGTDTNWISDAARDLGLLSDDKGFQRIPETERDYAERLRLGREHNLHTFLKNADDRYKYIETKDGVRTEPNDEEGIIVFRNCFQGLIEDQEYRFNLRDLTYVSDCGPVITGDLRCFGDLAVLEVNHFDVLIDYMVRMKIEGN